MKIVGDGLRLSASDVANFVACQHLTRLDLLNARHQLPRDRAFDLGFEDLVKRGEGHEGEVLSRFRADGCSITQISVAPGAEAEAARDTLEAIRGGADVIYQGALVADGADGGAALLGRPDFLVRADLLGAPDGKPRPDGMHYEVVDAKLARTAKARAVAQTAFYSQGTRRANINVILIGPSGVFVIDVKAWRNERVEHGRLGHSDAPSRRHSSPGVALPPDNASAGQWIIRKRGATAGPRAPQFSAAAALPPQLLCSWPVWADVGRRSR